jgi:putative ABC transport system permease protein
LKPLNHKPPKLAKKVLLSFLREEISEEVQGDLEEKFYSNLKKSSIYWSKLNYWYQVLNYLRPFAIKKYNSRYSNYLTMHQHNIKISWRSLTKQKIYSLIKIGGLSVGIAASLLVGLFIKYSLSYDKHYPDSDLLYRVIGVYDETGSAKSPYYPAALEGYLKSDFPEIDIAGRFMGNELIGMVGIMVKRPEDVRNIYEDGFIFMDQGLLDILKPHFVNGNPSQVLSEPFSMAISESKAEKFFPKENPIGKSLILNNDEKQPYIIKGVYKDFPAASFSHYDFLLSLAGTESWTGDPTSWRANIHQTFIKILPGTNTMLLASKMTDDIAKTYMLTSMRNAGMINADEIIKKFTFKLQPVKDIYLKSSGINDGLNHGDIRFVWIFAAVAIFILIIACINFINLSTARSANRAKEIGLRKVVGSSRRNLVSQFLVESTMFSMLAFIVALLIAMVFLSYFNKLTALSLNLPWNEWWFLPLLISSAIVIGVIAGIYPAIYLSAFKPIRMLRGEVAQGSRSSIIRSILVIFQFTTSFILIISTFIIYRQFNFILRYDSGFKKEQVIQINGTEVMKNQLPVFKKELQKLPNIESVSISNFLPIAGAKRNGNMFWKEGGKDSDKPVEGQIWYVDNDYIKTMGMKIMYGRDFNFEMASDSQSVIINQTMAKSLGLGKPIGQQIITTWANMKVIGVVKDFNYESLTRNIGPLCLVLGKSPSVVSVRCNISDMTGVIKSVNALWDQFCPNDPVRYTFLEESYAAMYSDVKRTERILLSFSILTVIIACLGLYALSSYMVEQRNKEVSIRLVMGASLNNIYRLLTQDFLILIVISLILAIPVAWYFMHKWIESYAYRIQISWDVFVLAGAIGILITILTISYQSIKAAFTNPVDKLR